jgi:two-component system LytT family sensor kinase
MIFNSIIENIKHRIALGVGVGIASKFICDVIFSLIYRHYSVIQPLLSYFLVLVVVLILIETYYRIELKLNKIIEWNSNPSKRFVIQLLRQLLFTLVIVIAFRTIFLFAFFTNSLLIILDEVIILIGVTLICLIYNLVSFWLYLVFRWRHSLAEIERIKKENADFKFEMLRNQVNPHFLFNSLNTLSSLMYQNVDTAAHYIRRLSEVYRYVLENRQNELVTLDKELKFIDAYKYLFELRFADRISIKIDIGVDNQELFIAPMTLQMLVENAVKHNVVSTKLPLHITIKVSDKMIIVSNNLQPKKPEGYSSGMGLQNIQNQYEFLSDKKVEIINNQEEFSVKVPLLAKNQIVRHD